MDFYYILNWVGFIFITTSIFYTSKFQKVGLFYFIAAVIGCGTTALSLIPVFNSTPGTLLLNLLTSCIFFYGLIKYLRSCEHKPVIHPIHGWIKCGKCNKQLKAITIYEEMVKRK